MRGNRFTESLNPNEKNISILLILMLALWYDLFLPQNTYMGRLFQPESSPLYMESPLYTLLLGWLQPWGIINDIAALLLFIATGGLLIRFNGTFAYIKVRTILPAVFFCILGSIFFCHTLTPGIFLSVLLIGGLYSSFFYVETFNPIHAFNAGLFISIATLLSPTYILLIIPYFIFFHSTSALNLRSFLASLFGFIIPALYATLYYVVIGETATLTEFFSKSFSTLSIQYRFNDLETAYLLFLGCTTAWAIGHFILDNTHDNIKSRKQNTHINSLFLWILALMIIGFPDSQNLLYPLTLLWSMILGRFFSINSSRIAYIVFFLFLAISLLTFILA